MRASAAPVSSFPGAIEDTDAAQTPPTAAPVTSPRARSGFGPGKDGAMVQMWTDENGDILTRI